ncbi:hypothetical protein [Actinocrispum sp. NPDC049592]|uniref:hypothetical protein n=1 Tax=Actinocrispum sp. NPDC049592 TaxID=3154835 RepID=UPI003437385A
MAPLEKDIRTLTTPEEDLVHDIAALIRDIDRDPCVLPEPRADVRGARRLRW